MTLGWRAAHLALALGVPALGAPAGVAQRLPSPPVAEGQCPAIPDGRLLVSGDSVGYLPVRGTIAALRRLCPGARDTILPPDERGGDAVPALQMRFGAVQVFATQNAESLYARGSPDLWVIRGSPVFSAGWTELSVSWARIRSQHRPLRVDAFDGWYQVRLCDLPDIALYIPGAGPTGQLWPIRTDSAPPSAIVTEIWVLTGANAVIASDTRRHCEAQDR
jgi:hypothetical protein